MGDVSALESLEAALRFELEGTLPLRPSSSIAFLTEGCSALEARGAVGAFG